MAEPVSRARSQSRIAGPIAKPSHPPTQQQNSPRRFPPDIDPALHLTPQNGSRGHPIPLLNLLLLLAAPAVPPPPTTPGLLGDWIASDKSIIRIYKCESALCLKIVYVNPAIGHTTDGLNPDPAKRGQPLCALVIGTGFHQKNATHAEGGKLYDPESGNVYSGTIALDGAMLRLHGYIGIAVFGRTEDWHRAPAAHPTCE